MGGLWGVKPYYWLVHIGLPPTKNLWTSLRAVIGIIYLIIAVGWLLCHRSLKGQQRK